MRTRRSYGGVLAIALGFLLAGAESNAIPRLTGRVTTAGEALPGVTVTATRPGAAAFAAATGSDGTYLFANLPSGEYEVSFVLEGFRTVTERLRLGPADARVANTSLEIDPVADILICICDPVLDREQAHREGRVVARTLEVLDEDGAPITGARAEGIGIEGQPCVADAGGWIHYEVVDGDDRNFKIVADGFRSVELSTCCSEAVSRVTLRRRAP